MFTLPWPPSVNHYWRHCRGRTFISQEGQAFRTSVCALLAGGGPRKPPAGGRIALCMDAFPPDRRARDLDNLAKAVQDALGTHTDTTRGRQVVVPGVYESDCQIDLLVLRRQAPAPGGHANVSIGTWPGTRCPLCGGTPGAGVGFYLN